MSQQEKNNLFAVLRKYHESPFPAKFSSKEMDGLKTELEAIQDKITSMILSFVYGKAGFVDSSNELSSFEVKVKACPSCNKLENSDKNLLVSKIDQLLKILELAKGATFKLR